MSLSQIPQATGARVYSVSVGKSLPEWVASAKKNSSNSSHKNTSSLRHDSAYRKRVELLQGFDCPSYMRTCDVSSDGSFLMCLGGYAPRVVAIELQQLSVKFERHIEAEGLAFQSLSDNGSDRFAILRENRTIAFFRSGGGIHFSLKIPRAGRTMCYHEPTADLWAGGAGADLFRVNLELGQFMEPLRLSSSIVQTRSSSRSSNSAFDYSNGIVNGINEFHDSGVDNGVNSLSVCGVHGLVAAGTAAGMVEFFDPRAGSHAVKHAAVLDVLSASASSASGFGTGTLRDAPLSAGGATGSSGLSGNFNEVTVTQFDLDGLTVGVGTASGHVLLYDLRASDPFAVKDHQYGFPIRHVSFPRCVGSEGGRRILSADTQVIKLWGGRGSGDDANSSSSISLVHGEDNTNSNGMTVPSLDSAAGAAGSTWVSIEPGCQINDVCAVADSGLIFAVGEQPQGMVFYLPELGPAPLWCSFLENLTEELEEDAVSAQALYDDFRFVSREEAEQLNLLNMAAAGSSAQGSLLKPYLHGFFVDARLYAKARAMAQPFEFQEYRREQIQKRLAAKSGNRVSALAVLQNALADREKATKVNADLAGTQIAQDERFAAMFEDEDFRIEKSNERYHQLNSSSTRQSAADARQRREVLDSLETDINGARAAIAGEFLPSAFVSRSTTGDSARPDIDYGSDFGDDAYDRRRADEEDDGGYSSQPEHHEMISGTRDLHKSTARDAGEGRLVEVHGRASGRSGQDMIAEQNLSFADRLALAASRKNTSFSTAQSNSTDGDAMMNFIPSDVQAERQERDRANKAQRERQLNKRSVRSLGLSSMRVPGGFRPRK